jgi:hypothetical protein
MNEGLLSKVKLYASRRKLQVAETLGSGKDGTVWVARNKGKPADVAIKVFSLTETYFRERGVYARLQHLAITNVVGFNIPQALGFDDELLAIEMTIVKRPFVLDFAGAYLDARPQFPEDIWREWEAEKREQFEERWPVVEQVLEAFQELGIYLLDISPGNIGFEL